MVDFEFEIPEELHALIGQCETGCEIEGKIEPKKGGVESAFRVDGGVAACTLAAILLTAQVCIGAAAQQDHDPMREWYVITKSVQQVILDNTEEVTDHDVRGQTT